MFVTFILNMNVSWSYFKNKCLLVSVSDKKDNGSFVDLNLDIVHQKT